MNQSDVNGAVIAFLENGDPGPWMQVLEAIRDGRVLAEPRKNTLTLTAIPRPATFRLGKRLADLQAESGVEREELARLTATSLSSVTRHLRGQVLGAWAVISMMITAMGGDPADYRDDYDAARAEYWPG